MINKNKHYFIKMKPLNTTMGISFTSSSDKSKWVECKVVEDRYKVEDEYKITLKSIEDGYGIEHFYQSDFKSLLKSGHIIEKTKETQHEEKIVWDEPLGYNVNIRHEASVIVE